MDGLDKEGDVMKKEKMVVVRRLIWKVEGALEKYGVVIKVLLLAIFWASVVWMVYRGSESVKEWADTHVIVIEKVK